MRNIIITGFMGTGKTTVGRILEKKLNMKFVDTDNLIESRAGKKIADIFKNDGEDYFRKLESEVIMITAKESNQIIATGGGAILNENNLQALKDSGKLFSLFASPDIIVDRVSSNNKRPLLNVKDVKEEVERLLAIRMERYKKADYLINTDGKSAVEIAELIENIISAKYETVSVNLGIRSYDIKIGAGALNNIGAELNSLGFNDRAVIVTNKTIKDLYCDKLYKSLDGALIKHETIIVEDGEKSKSLKVVNDIITKLLEFKCERNTPLIALGGGVIGDLTGFSASIYLRGVPFVQVPTTLLAQVDSSVGGKTGVNHEYGKNLIGTFYQPKLVMVDTDFLKTLPMDEYLNGISEIIKYGVIKDAALFRYLEDSKNKILAMGKDSIEQVAHIIKRSCEIKAEVVSLDEKESGLRSILNFGHTLGHALEATGSYKGIKHGRAVAIGMIFAAKLAVMRGMCDSSVVDRITNLIKAYGISTDIEIKYHEKIIDTMRLDKKVKKGNIKFILPKEIGSVEYDVNVKESEIINALTSYNN